MQRYDIITLVSDTPAAHGIYDSAGVTETERTVYAEIRSVGMKETYEAMSQGLAPEVRFKLSIMEDYGDEHKVVWNGKRYRVIRTYVTNDGGIELTCGRWNDDI